MSVQAANPAAKRTRMMAGFGIEFKEILGLGMVMRYARSVSKPILTRK